MRAHRGFTLVEMMLVVVIIGVVYGLVISGMKRYSEKAYDISLYNLPLFLAEQFSGRTVSLICTDACRSCGVYEDGKLVADVKGLLQDPVESYRFDHRYGVSEVRWSPLFDKDGQEEEVCFRFDTDGRGKNSELLVRSEKQVIAYGGYFGSVQRFESIEDAMDNQEELRQKVMQ